MNFDGYSEIDVPNEIHQRKYIYVTRLFDDILKYLMEGPGSAKIKLHSFSQAHKEEETPLNRNNKITSKR